MPTIFTDPTTGIPYERRFVPADTLSAEARAHHAALGARLAPPPTAAPGGPPATHVGPAVPLAAATAPPTPEDVDAEITALAQRLQRATPSLSFAAAYTAVLEARPDLYAAYERAYAAVCAAPPPQTEGDDPAWQAAKRRAHRTAQARAAQKCQQTDLSWADALAAVFREDPDLYAAYVAETTQAEGGRVTRPIR